MAATIPQKCYVTVQYRADAGADTGHLGFLSPYTRDSAFAKRKATQDSWAYGNSLKVEIDAEDEITCTGSGTAYSGGSSNKWDASMLFTTGSYPRIVTNEPLEGFEIAKSVRRYGWGSGGNVVWRITDPRGFDIEINSENFASIVDCVTIVNGKIQGRCVWARDGARNLLLPEASQPYQDAVKETIKHSTTVPLKQVKIGDTVTLLSKKVSEKRETCTYLGKYWFVESPKIRYEQVGHTEEAFDIVTRQVERYLFRAGQEYFVLSNPKISRIDKPATKPLTPAEVCSQVAAHMQNPEFHIDDAEAAFLISPGKIVNSDIKFDLAPFRDTDQISRVWDKVESGRVYALPTILCKVGEDWGFLTAIEEHRAYNTKPGLALTKVDELWRGRVVRLADKSSMGSGYYSRSYMRAQTIDITRDQADLYRIRAQWGDVVTYVNNLY